MSKRSKANVDGFTKAVEKALVNFQDPVWLTTESPLATPYFLGHTLDKYQPKDDENYQGYVLQSALREAAQSLSEEQYKLLDLAFFNRNTAWNNVRVAMALNMSERTFFRNKNKTVQALAQHLVKKLIPPLRTEVPLRQAMIGRQAIFTNVLESLEQGDSVYLTGPSGTGKTTLGAALSDAWNNGQGRVEQPYTFWYTIRPGFNDYLANFIFALGYFLHKHRASYTWRQLIADQGKIKLAHLVNVIRYDLESLADRNLLFCIDEVDLLEAESLEHIQIIHLLEELSKLNPLLLIGQRAIIEADTFHALTGFDNREIAEYLKGAGLAQPSADGYELLRQRTHGNPALLTLLKALDKLGGNIDEGLKALENAPSAEALYVRIWRRLNNEERHLLLQLAVFRNPAPTDAWSQEIESLEHLQQYGLVQNDGLGAVFIMPHIRKISNRQTPAELKPLLHQRAGEIHEERHNILSAMYHYIAADQAALAVWLWYINRDQEAEQGHATGALQLLQQISSTSLTHESDRKILLVSRASLFKLTGHPEEAATDLANTVVPNRGSFSSYVQQLQGEVLEMQGQAEQAIQKYRGALETLLGAPIQREVTMRVRMGFLHEFSFQERADARREALLARLKAEGFHGNIEEMAGNYQAARARYQAAYDIAQQLGGNHSGILAQVYAQLGALELREGRTAYAIELIEKAIDLAKKRGNVEGPLYDMLNLAYAHTVAQNYDQAFAVAYDGLQTAQRLGLSYLVAGLACGVGEACCGLGRLEEAEQYGQLSLAQEEGYFRCWGLALLGVVRTRQNNYEEAKTILNEAIESAKYSADQYGEAHCWHMLGECLSAAANKTRTIQAFEASLALYETLELGYKIDELRSLLRYTQEAAHE